VKHLDNKVLDSLIELRTRELCLEHTIAANDDLQHHVTRQTKKLESMNVFLLSPGPYALLNTSLTPLQLTETEAELKALNAMVENAVAFFYPDDPASAARAPQLLDGLPTQS
jgi:hypothetical protein